VTVVIRVAGPDDHEPAIRVWEAADEARRGQAPPPEVPDLLPERFT
jgi:hypothetical protein